MGRLTDEEIKILQSHYNLQKQVAELTAKNNFMKKSYKERLQIESEIAEMLGLEVDCGVLERIANKVKELTTRAEQAEGREKALRDKLEEYGNEIIRLGKCLVGIKEPNP